MLRSFTEDYKLGILSEERVKPILEEKFDLKLLKLNKTHFYDYLDEDKNIYVEIKSRCTKYNQFNTTLIGDDKLKYAQILLKRNPNTTFKLVFVFVDGTYYIDYDDELFSTFETKFFRRRTRTDFTDYEKEYCYIPINRLIKID
jgi:hypothetical protein